MRLSCLVAALLACAQAEPPLPLASSGGPALQVTVEYRPPEDPTLAPIRDAFAQNPWLDDYASDLSGTFRSGAHVTITLEQCGAARVHWVAAESRVVLCYELVRTLGVQVPRAEAARAGVLGFILLHELGHALIDLLELPVDGRDEEFADELAVSGLVRASQRHVAEALRVEAWLDRDDTSPRPSPVLFPHEHAFGVRRIQAVLCWLDGSGRFGRFRSTLRWLRGRNCGAEYRQMERRVERLLAPHRLDVAAPGS